MQDIPDPLPDLAHHEGYRLKVTTHPKRMRAIFNGKTIADSAHVLVMRETNYPPVYYFPRDDVAMNHLQPVEHLTHCPFKGDARYWSLNVEDRLAQNAAWSYPEPYDEAAVVKDHIAFYWDEIDAWLEDGEPMAAPERSAETDANPLIAWLLEKAWQPQSIPELLRAMSKAMMEAGFRCGARAC